MAIPRSPRVTPLLMRAHQTKSFIVSVIRIGQTGRDMNCTNQSQSLVGQAGPRTGKTYLPNGEIVVVSNHCVYPKGRPAGLLQTRLRRYCYYGWRE